MRKKTIQWVSENLSDPQLVRVADLVIRRMIDAGVENYDEEDKKLFQKMKMIKERATSHDVLLLWNGSKTGRGYLSEKTQL
mgnify:FL=1